MNWKKVILWSLPLVTALVIMMIVVRPGNTQEYNQFKDGFNSLASGQTVFLSEGVEMRRGVIFVWVSRESGFSQPYLVFSNTCTNIPFKFTSVHDNSVNQVEVIVCNIEGDTYYRVPISS